LRTATRNRTYNRCLCLFATVLTGHIGTNLLPVILNHILLSHLYQVFICCTSGNTNRFSNLCSRWGLSVLQVIILDILFYLTHKFRTLASHTCTSLSFLSEALCFRYFNYTQSAKNINRFFGKKKEVSQFANTSKY